MPKAQTSNGHSLRGRRVASSLAEINVVPLVDVMLVLLIIFMVTAPMIQRGMDVKVPVSRRAGPIQGERVFVTVPEGYRQSRTVFINQESVRVDVLGERIRQKMETLDEKQVYLTGDRSVLYEDLYDVFDRLKDAGVETVGLVARTPGER